MAGIAAATTATVTAAAAAAPGPDAGIIHALDELIALTKAITNLHAQRRTLEDEARTDPEMHALVKHVQAVKRRLEDLGAPATPAGAVALSRAVLADAPRDVDGDITCESFYEWGALMVAYWVEEHGGAST